MYEQDKELALATCKQWLEDNDAAYLAKEDVIIMWIHFNPESKRGEWQRYKMKEACRVIKATRAGFAAMRFIKPELLMLAAQETERAHKQAVKSRSTVPPEFFNLERAGHFNSLEILTMCMLQELVGRIQNEQRSRIYKLKLQSRERKKVRGRYEKGKMAGSTTIMRLFVLEPSIGTEKYALPFQKAPDAPERYA